MLGIQFADITVDTRYSRDPSSVTWPAVGDLCMPFAAGHMPGDV